MQNSSYHNKAKSNENGTVCFAFFISFRKSCSGEIESFLFSSCSWIDFPLFHDFLTLYLQVSHTARLIYHLHNFQADTFSNTFRQFTNYILFSSLIGKSKSSQSAAIDITQHARIDHKRQQREKFKTKYQQL